MEAPLTDRRLASADSTARRITYEMKGYFGDDFPMAMELLPLIHKVVMSGDMRLARIPSAAAAFCMKHGIDFEEVE
jgi:hypothetical protein